MRERPVSKIGQGRMLQFDTFALSIQTSNLEISHET
jgi:hypothetical protein